MTILGPPVGYTDLLDYEIAQKLETDKEKRKNREVKGFNPIRPSNSGKCARALANDLMEYRGHVWHDKAVLEPRMHRLFELGHAIEMQALRTFQLLKVVEQRYKQQILTFFPLETANEDTKKEILEGSCDFVFWSEKYKAIGDVKSKKDKFSAAYKTNWDEELARFSEFQSLVQLSETAFYADDLVAFINELGPDDFLCDNLFQLNLYALSEFIVQRGVDHCFLYRYNKNDSRHMEIRFRPSKAVYDYVKKKFNTVNVAVDNKNPCSVEKEFWLGSQHCAFCDYKAGCWDEDALKEYFKQTPKSWPTDIDKLPQCDLLKAEFEKYETASSAGEAAEKHEGNILSVLTDEKVKCRKIKLTNGHVYEVKLLKTPRPHLELRRSKI